MASPPLAVTRCPPTALLSPRPSAVGGERCQPPPPPPQQPPMGSGQQHSGGLGGWGGVTGFTPLPPLSPVNAEQCWELCLFFMLLEMLHGSEGRGSRWWGSDHPIDATTLPPALQSGQGQPQLSSLRRSCSITCLQLLQGCAGAILQAGEGLGLRSSVPQSHGDGHGRSWHVLTCVLPNLIAPHTHPTCRCWGGRLTAASAPARPCLRALWVRCVPGAEGGGAGGMELSADGAGNALGSCRDAAAHRLPHAAEGKGSPHSLLPVTAWLCWGDALSLPATGEALRAVCLRCA